MAEFLLALHFLFILYMIVGFPVGLKTNHRAFRLMHAGLLAGVTLLMLLGFPCPLTAFEVVLAEIDSILVLAGQRELQDFVDV